MITYKRVFPLACAFVIIGSILWTSSLSRRAPDWSAGNAQQQPAIRESLSRTFPYEASSDLPKLVWQTWKFPPAQEEFDNRFRSAVSSWDTLNPDFEHQVVTDETAVDLVHRLFNGVPEVYEAYDALPKPVLKADFFRYLILLARGGVYSDIDTTALKPVARWIPAELEPFGLGVGIEADPDRPDWHDWYARRLQFCQWTITGKPGHPVVIDVVASITEEALERKTRNELRPQFMKTVMEFTGPGFWTDSSETAWQQFANLRKPTKARDILVLPLTSFSPGVGHMGSGWTSDPLAFVSHGFGGMISVKMHKWKKVYANLHSGTWKHDERRPEGRPV